MTRPATLVWRLLFLTLLLTQAFQLCFAAKDPFSLTAKSVDKNNGPSDAGYIDDGYACGFGNLGFMLNGHGLPDTRRTFVITHQSAGGKTELIWPVFIYGNDQANAVVLDHTLVFLAMLPNRSSVLMAHRLGNPPMVISPAILRLAALRLGTSAIVPGTDYNFTKVRLPPDRVWLKGQSIAASNSSPEEFTLELTAEDLRKVIDETTRRGKLNKANKFEYIAEEGSPNQISSQEAEQIRLVASPPRVPPATAVFHKISGYSPRNERLDGDVLLDLATHHAYFSTIHEPGRILKIALGNDVLPFPTVVGVAVLEGEEDNPVNSALDPRAGYAYFATEFPGHLVKVALGASNTPPYRVGSVSIDPQWSVGPGIVDSDAGYGYFAVSKRLYKIRLGKGDEPPSVACHIELPNNAGPGVLEPAARHAYFAADRAVYKVALENGDSPPRFIGAVSLLEDEWGLRGALIDPESGFAWFTSQNGRFIKVALGEKDNPPRRIGALKMPSKYQYLMNTFGMDKAGYAYLGTTGGGKVGDPECCVAGVLKIALGKGEELPRIVSFMPLPDGVEISEGIVAPDSRTLYLGVNWGPGSKLLTCSLGKGDAPQKSSRRPNSLRKRVFHNLYPMILFLRNSALLCALCVKP